MVDAFHLGQLQVLTYCDAPDSQKSIGWGDSAIAGEYRFHHGVHAVNVAELAESVVGVGHLARGVN